MVDVKNRKRLWLAFCVISVAAVTLAIVDGYMFCWWSSNKWIDYNHLYEAYGSDIGKLIGRTPNLLQICLLVISMVCLNNRKRVLGIAFSSFHLLLSVLLFIGTFQGTSGKAFIYLALWIAYLALSVFILYYAIKRRYSKAFIYACLVFGCISIVVTFFLTSYTCAGNLQIRYGFGRGSLWQRLTDPKDYNASQVWPLSKGLSYFVSMIGFVLARKLDEKGIERERQKMESKEKRKQEMKQKAMKEQMTVTVGEKSQVVAGILAFFLGGAGAHRYYLGYIKQGVIQSCDLVCAAVGSWLMFMHYGYGWESIVGSILTLCGSATTIWALVDFIRILTGGLKPADGSDYVGKETIVQVVQSTPSASDNVDALEKLAKLREQGVLTDEEFAAKKADILAKM